MICDDNIKDEKLQYIINSQPAKISTLSSVKLINMNIQHTKKYYLTNKVKL